MKDCYHNFAELAQKETYGIDYQIRYAVQRLDVLVMAPHGGGIEPGTSQIALKLAENGFSWYLFEGLKAQGNYKLHLTSHRFDEPAALKMAASADIILTVHGHHSFQREYIMLGGRHEALGLAIRQHLEFAGFSVFFSEHGQRGTHPLNICNRSLTKQGVQLEISRLLRLKLISTPLTMNILADSIQKAIAGFTQKSGECYPSIL